MSSINWGKWKTEITTVITLMLITGVSGFGWNWAKGKVQQIDILQSQMRQIPKAEDVQKLQKAIEGLTEQVGMVQRIQLTVTGRARIQQTDGESCCIRINTSSRAANFAGYSKVKITNLSHADTPSTIVNIRGTFRNSDTSYLAVISREAASLIDAAGKSVIDVRIEPED